MLYRRPSVYIIFLANLLVNAGLVRFFEEAVSLIVITAGVIISTPLIKTGTQKATKTNNQTNKQPNDTKRKVVHCFFTKANNVPWSITEVV